MQNTSFELGVWHKTYTGVEYDNIFVPESWTAWWKEDSTYGRIEMQVISAVVPFLDPPRVHEGAKALKFFTMWRIHQAGLLQTVATIPGTKYRVRFFAHAWSSQDDNAHTSEGAPGAFFALEGTAGLTDDQRNIALCAGIDLSGGTNPFGANVRWGQGAHIYNAYAQVPVLEFTATGTSATVFLRSSVLWPFKHLDIYMDAVTLEIADVIPEPVDCPQPREDYERVYALIPPEHDAEWVTVLAPAIDAHRITTGFSADDAGYGPGLPKRTVLALNPGSWNGDLPAFYEQYYPSTADSILEYVPINAATPPEWLAGVMAYYAGGEPNPNPGEYDYPVLAFGSKLHPHGVSEAGTFDMLQWLHDFGYTLPYVKLALAKEQDLVEVTNLQALSPGTKFIVRLQTIGGSRGIETPNFRTGSADDYMALILPFMVAYPQVSFWELWNEIDPGDTAGHVALAKFACDCIDVADAHGVKLALMSYSTGMPEPEEWQAIFTQTQLFQKAKTGGHILSLHAYGSVNNPGDLTYHILRPLYQLYEPILIPADNVIPYVFTEWNINNGPLPIEQWLPELAGIDNLLAEQYFCLGIAIFTFGAQTAWPNHDMTVYWQQVANLIYSTRNRENALPPDSGEPEPPLMIIDVRDLLQTNPDSPWYPWAQRTLDEVTTVFVHHTAWAEASTLEAVQTIATYHCEGKDRPGICYTYVIGYDGTIFYTSSIENVVFAQGVVNDLGDENRWGLAVSLMGCFINGSEPSAAQIASLTALIAYLEDLAGRTLPVWGHKDVDLSNQCPGDSWPFKPEWGRISQLTLIGFNDCDGPNGSASQWMMEH